MKKSEARIMVFIKHAAIENTYVSKIAAKLNIDYGYCITIINNLVEQGFMVRHLNKNKTFLELTKKAPLVKAQQIVRDIE